MGIHGLTSFLNKTYLDSILEDLKLNNQILLIDGYSLLHKFHQQNSLQSTHGGNYDEFSFKLNNLFDLFKKCKLQPVFLFDGGRDKSDRKFQTNLKRANDRLHETCALNTFENNNADRNNNNRKKSSKLTKINLVNLINSGSYRIFHNFLPIMAFKVLFDLLNKFEFVHFQTNFEADYELACLANELNAIILSCDSDFYVYDLNYGYISIDYFEMDINYELDQDQESQNENDNPSKYYFPVKIYKLDTFIDYYNKTKLSKINPNLKLNKLMMPIFAILLGNDYVDQSTFKSLLNTFESSNNNMKFKGLKRSVAKQKNICFHRLLEWLAKYDNNVEQCVETMLKFVKKDLHEQIRLYVKESIDEYMCLKPSSSSFYKNIILKKFGLVTDDSSLNKMVSIPINHDITTYNGNILKNDFLKNFQECKLTRFCLDALVHRKVIFRCQLEVAEWPSSFISSINIRKFFYTILIKKYELIKTDETCCTIKEYLRYQNQIKIYEILIDLNNINLHQIISSIDLLYIFKKIFNFNSNISHNLANNFPKLSIKFKYFFSTIFYWLNTTFDQNEKFSNELIMIKNSNCIKAFIVSLIKSSIIDPVLQSIKSLKNIKSHGNTINNNDLLNQPIRNYEAIYSESNVSMADRYLLDGFSIFEELKNEILSNESNYEYIKEISIKLNSYCPFLVINNSLISKSSSAKANKLLNLRLVHCLCEFQSIYLSLNYAKEVLDLLDLKTSIDLLNIELFFNGTFLHNFIEELEHRVKPNLFIEEIFGRKSLFKYLYIELLRLFDNIFLSEYNKDV